MMATQQVKAALYACFASSVSSLEAYDCTVHLRWLCC